MDGMQQEKFERELERLRTLHNSPEITIFAAGTFAKRVLNIFAAQCQLKNVRTVVIDTSESPEFSENIQTKVLLSGGISEESISNVTDKLALEKSDIIVILTALGGYTSSVLAPVIAEIGKGMGCIVIPVAIMPFSFEKERRARAEQILAALKQSADIVIVLDNDDIPKKIKLSETPNYISRRLLNILDNITPSVSFAVVERILKEIEAELKKVTVQVPKTLEQSIILKIDGSTADDKKENKKENYSFEIEEIEIEKVVNEQLKQKLDEAKIISTETGKGEKSPGDFSLASEVQIVRDLEQNHTREPEMPENPDKGRNEEKIRPQTELGKELGE